MKNASSGPRPGSVDAIARQPEWQEDAERGQDVTVHEQDAERRDRLHVVAQLAEVEQRGLHDVAQPEHVEEKRAVVGGRVMLIGIRLEELTWSPAFGEPGERLVERRPVG